MKYVEKYIMKQLILSFLTGISAVTTASASTWYVSPDSMASGPGTAWSNAWHTIQAGVDAASVGDTVLVSNGTYSVTSEITVNAAITIKSIDSQGTTIVEANGYCRCFNLGEEACYISGFTLTNGLAYHEPNQGGAIYCDNSTVPVVSNCVFSGNTAVHNNPGPPGKGAGMYYGTAYHCLFTGNLAGAGAGMYAGIANDCRFVDNQARHSGGGMYYGTANRCSFVDNQAPNAGGQFWGTANSCVFLHNAAESDGGGKLCGEANSCTFIHNSAGSGGGGMDHGSATNCIAWYNSATGSGNNFNATTTYYCCSPDLTNGVDGCITNEPLFASTTHPAEGSPCIGAGDGAYTPPLDIAGKNWATPPSMGCAEFSTNAVGRMEAFLWMDDRASTGQAISIQGGLVGLASMLFFDFGDGTVLSNQLNATHSWSTTGQYPVVLAAFNTDHPSGISVTSVLTVAEADQFVSPEGDNTDGLSWATAKHSLQNAVDSTPEGGRVLVTNGTYQVYSEINVPKSIEILSVNGPDVTIINGHGSKRCINLGYYNTFVSGFRIQNGYDDVLGGGGVFCSSDTPVVSNCVFSGNSGNNHHGGGMLWGTAIDCSFTNNSGSYGGGMYEGRAIRCTFESNTAYERGGGASDCVADECLFKNNFSWKSGGGISGGIATGCCFVDNYVYQQGGGMYGGTAKTCAFVRNRANGSGGGMYAGTANNCTFFHNHSPYGGGISVSSATNCIVWGNTANTEPNLYLSSLNHCCSPTLTNGVDGCISNAPLLVSSTHIAMGSPCIGAGISPADTDSDLDGEAWGTSPSMGCDEPNIGTGGSPDLYLTASATEALSGKLISFQCDIIGAATRFVLDFGDGLVAENQMDSVHIWENAGEYAVVLSAFNADYPAGVSITQIVQIAEASQYVSPTGNDASSGTSWAEAKRTIQAAVDETPEDGRILVADGTYALTAEILVADRMEIRSMNGPDATMLDGGGISRCVRFNHTGCMLSGFTMANGYAQNGAGVYGNYGDAVISNCVFSGNSSSAGGGALVSAHAIDCVFSNNTTLSLWGGAMWGGSAADCLFVSNAVTGRGGATAYSDVGNSVFIGNSATTDGGGMYSGTANNCLLFANSAGNNGGGMHSVKASACTLSKNSATQRGGGAYDGEATNCIVWYNTAASYDDMLFVDTSHVCSPKVVAGDHGNITNAPLFVDIAQDDFHLMPSSFCIDAGANSVANGDRDLDGSPRIANATVDIGAFEFFRADPLNETVDSDADGIPDIWEDEWFGGATCASALLDSDGDVFDNFSEYIVGSNPTNTDSLFHVYDEKTNTLFVLKWDPVVEKRTYSVLWAETLTNKFQLIESNLDYPCGSYTDTNHATKFQGFYRVEVNLQ
ncbi:MAG: choice-of-anchor Q domain-containing protein [Verrucomicrobiota bacterium]|nr:choice-of-anchor Q domain-containing protein [Verrucomicrobiota bacterium]